MKKHKMMMAKGRGEPMFPEAGMMPGGRHKRGAPKLPQMEKSGREAKKRGKY